jgi:hypothetical protein
VCCSSLTMVTNLQGLVVVEFGLNNVDIRSVPRGNLGFRFCCITNEADDSV